MNQMILKTLEHWSSLKNDELIYVGRWGDERREGHNNLWTRPNIKSETDRINLAIVKLKEEYDFVDNEIIKYIEILNSLELIEEDIYLKIKYGTSNKEKIALLNTGLSNGLSNILYDKYRDLYTIDKERNVVYFDSSVVQAMRDNFENEIQIAEIKMNSAIR